MGNLNRVFHIANNAIGKASDGTIEDELESIGAANIKTFPSWILQTMVKPVPVLAGAEVERYSIDVENANTSFIDIHTYEEEIMYAKIFFLYSIHQIFKIKGAGKKVSVLAQKHFGNHDDMLTQRLRPVVGPENRTYMQDNVALVTCVSSAMAQKEFQLHFYLRGFFEALFM